jgi:tetratricopeptide (TPR) repeat protein
MSENQIKPEESSEGTRVDLGEDLMDKTALSVNPLLASDAIDQDRKPQEIPEMIENAKILFNEGLYEDAKKILHQIVIQDPHNVVARKQLRVIQEQQLNQMLRDAKQPSQPDQPEEVDPEAVLRDLDKELNLGIYSGQQWDASVNQLSLFQNSEELDSLYENLEKELIHANVQDWIDLGIAFLEIELYPIAVKLFLGACRTIKVDASDYVERSVSATSLLALALYLEGKSFEAISKIQPILMDTDIKREFKTELFYLLGRVYETLGKPEFAQRLYLTVGEIEPDYRDTTERLKRFL